MVLSGVLNFIPHSIIVIVRLVVHFHYGGEWIKVPKLVYLRKFVHTWEGYDSDLLCFSDLVDQFKNLGFIGVQQLVLNGPSGKYYEMEFDTGIRTLLYLSYSIDVEAGTDYDSINEALNSSSNDSSDDDFDVEELELIRLQNKREITLKLEHFKTIYHKMSFKDTLEAIMFINFYALAENKGLILLKSDKSRVSNTTTVLEPDLSLRLRSFSEANTRILERMNQTLATPTRRNSFVGDSTGMSHPTNMPYQPPNKADVTRNKLRVTKEKMKTRQRNGKSQT
ncbi:hypothetical protein RND71_002144 [Anisodus tanguticus]|uniref:PB1-like domain-containing protein n=1 Tax=Anisodus tanguticus TaxID=243964 RepID=A0AAE1T3D7_9SOLA|nr:hypothetical protein RND71_002144 [Anisodus tanguticus]